MGCVSGVSCAGGEVVGADGVCDALLDDGVDVGHGLGVEMPVEDAECGLELLRTFGAPERDTDAGPVEHPADGEFGDGFAEALAGKRVEPTNGVEILGKTRRLEFGVEAANVVEARLRAETAAEQAAAKRAVADDGDVVLRAPREDFRVDGALEEVVGRLVGGKRRDGSETLHLGDGEVADAECANLAGALKAEKNLGCFGDIDGGVGPVDLIEIDVVGVEATEAVLEFGEQARGREIGDDGGATLAAGGRRVFAPVEAGFGGEVEILAAAMLTDGLAEEFFGAAVAVDGSGVDEVDAVIDGGEEGVDGVGFRDRAPLHAAHGPGAEADARDAVAAEGGGFHLSGAGWLSRSDIR